MKGKLFSVGRIALGLAASGGLGWLVVRGLDWGVVRDALEGVSFSLIFLAVVVFMAASVLRAYRWQILFVSEKISVLRLFIVQNEGIGLNNVSPIRVISEPTQLAVLTVRDKVKGSTALATLGMERVIDLVASTLILGVALLLVEEMQYFKPFIWGALVITLIAVALVRLLAWGSEAATFIRRISFLAAFATAVRDLERERARLVTSLLVTVIYWIMVGITAWIISLAIGLSISPTTATLVALGTIFFATSVPAAPGALGTFEFAMVYTLEFFGVQSDVAIVFAVITHAVLFLPPMIIAAIFLPREGVLSLRRMRGLAARGAGAGHGPAS